MDKETLKRLTVAELREKAKAIDGVKGLSSMKKDDLVELVASHTKAKLPAAEASPGTKTHAKSRPKAKDEKKAKATSAITDRSQIKKAIRRLKEEKKAAIASGDRTTAKKCSRRIHDFKRVLRKMAREETAPAA